MSKNVVTANKHIKELVQGGNRAKESGRRRNLIGSDSVLNHYRERSREAESITCSITLEMNFAYIFMHTFLHDLIISTIFLSVTVPCLLRTILTVMLNHINGSS